ncbi:hypothetical protein OH77DRAFT_985804 [Trametes cingulata]|nr:hypothetical protein OH77DRAFT_985804 [Trametes cingulata]
MFARPAGPANCTVRNDAARNVTCWGARRAIADDAVMRGSPCPPQSAEPSCTVPCTVRIRGYATAIAHRVSSCPRRRVYVRRACVPPGSTLARRLSWHYASPSRRALRQPSIPSCMLFRANRSVLGSASQNALRTRARAHLRRAPLALPRCSYYLLAGLLRIARLWSWTSCNDTRRCGGSGRAVRASLLGRGCKRRLRAFPPTSTRENSRRRTFANIANTPAMERAATRKIVEAFEERHTPVHLREIQLGERISEGTTRRKADPALTPAATPVELLTIPRAVGVPLYGRASRCRACAPTPVPVPCALAAEMPRWTQSADVRVPDDEQGPTPVI